MADPGDGDHRRLLKAATGRDLEEFEDPSGNGFTEIGFSGPSPDKMALVLGSQRPDGSSRPFPHLTIPVDVSGAAPRPRADMPAHYTEVIQETAGDPTAMKERQTPVDLATGRPSAGIDKPAKSTWVRRASLGDGGLDVFVQRENTGADGTSKKGRVLDKATGGLDPRRTRRLSDAATARPASGIAPGFNAFKAKPPAKSGGAAKPPGFSDIPDRPPSPAAAALPPVASPHRPASPTPMTGVASPPRPSGSGGEKKGDV